MRKRIGAKMKQLLEVLQKADEPLTITELIMRSQGLEPCRLPPDEKHDKPWKFYIQNELASALIHESISSGFCPTPTWITKRESGKQYHPLDYADLLYAKYSRAIRRLKAYGLITDCGFRSSEQKCYRHVRTFRLTSRTDLAKINSKAYNYLYSAFGYKPYGNQ